MVDGRPDWPSRAGRRHRSNVCCKWSSKSACCSEVHSSYPARTIFPDNFTRPSVRTRRGSHPAPSGRPPRGGAKVTWFGYSCEYLGYSREDPGVLITLHYTALVCIYYTKLHCTLHSLTLQYITLYYLTLHYITLHLTTLKIGDWRSEIGECSWRLETRD